jgi:hypothetical protein
MQEDSAYLPEAPRRSEHAARLDEFVRLGTLDAYELTDEELARLLELWRWTAWTDRCTPNGIDRDIQHAAHGLQRELAERGIDLEYNTALLLKQEIEGLMHWRALADVPRALWYFVRRLRLAALVRAVQQARRYESLRPNHSEDAADRGYPRAALEAWRGAPPDLLRRRYWRSLTPHSFEERRRLKWWW